MYFLMQTLLRLPRLMETSFPLSFLAETALPERAHFDGRRQPEMARDIEAQVPRSSLSIYQKREKLHSNQGKQATLAALVLLVLIFGIIILFIAVLAPEKLSNLDEIDY
ncbi:hypothetical protein N7513_010848 [Penicillium frequentans]|nr:hypothetical protein N7513_010848 [Penicillium glabrum]